MTTFYARPAIPLLIGLITGIYLGSEFSDNLVWAAGLALMCAGLLIIFIARKQTAWLTPFLFFLALGYLSIQPWVSPRFPPHHIFHYLDGQHWNIEGVIVSRPLVSDSRQRFFLRSQRLKRDNEIIPAVGKLRVTVAGQGPILQRGDRVLLTSRIRSIRNFNNPGGFDYEKYMAFQGVWGSAYARGHGVTRLNTPKQNTLSGFIDNERTRIARIIEDTGSGPQISVLKALIVGDRSAISQPLREAFNRAGVSHLLAISGLHIGIVATVAFFVFKWALANIKPFLWSAWTRKGAALLSLLPICFYGIISGFSPSTQRALIMISVFLMTFLFEREHDLINTLCMAALIILMIFPPSLFSISFQLSFSAVLAIIYGLKCVQAQLRGREAADPRSFFNRMKQRLVSFFFVSFFAIGGTLPLAMFYFNQISMVGIFANFIIVPLVGFMVVPLGLVGVFLSPFFVAGASWCFKACGAVLNFALVLVELFADVPFAALKTFTPTVLEIACFYVLSWALLRRIAPEPEIIASHDNDNAFQTLSSDTKTRFRKLTTRFGFIQKGADAVGQLKRAMVSLNRRKLAGAVVVVVLLVLVGDVFYWYYCRFWHNDLKVTIVDVGPGSAALLELPGGYTMLIDGGGFSDNSTFDVGASVLAPLLWRKKIKTVDTLILSHPNSDHLNGLIYIAEHFNVQRVWTNNEVRDTFGYRTLMDIIAKENIQIPAFQHLPHKQTIHGVELDILYPRVDFLKKKVTEKWRNTNNNSLVIRVAIGSVSFLFPGDIMAEAERELVETCGPQLVSTVLMAPHHGSKSSSTDIFLDSVAARVVVISCGWKSRYKFPHFKVLQRYRQRGGQIYRTDIHGAVSFITDGQDLLIKPFRVAN
jgi:competence protein ComEC